jgi:alpha-maltose-1-phosphate synthase
MDSFSSCAIHFHPDGFTVPDKKILGRQSAGAGFLDAFLRYTSDSAVHCYARSREHFDAFRQRAEHFNWPAEKIIWIPLQEQTRLANVGCLYQPEPTLAGLAWNRRFLGSTAYSLCGVTHTLCSSGAMAAIADLAIAPTQNWDALVCTSTAAKSAVENLFAEWLDYLRQRLRSDFQLPLQLPVIPLGVHCDRFAARPDDQAVRANLRSQLKIAADDVAFLFVGRLSYHAKAHPFPLYAALEAAAQKTKKRLHLLHFGWFANQALQRDFVKAAPTFCPSVRVAFLDGSQAGLFEKIWLAADVFTSLADNVQETFGLTPLGDYFEYYHGSRTPLSLHRNAPVPRELDPPDRGSVISIPMVGGLHHRYGRRAA